MNGCSGPYTGHHGGSTRGMDSLREDHVVKASILMTRCCQLTELAEFSTIEIGARAGAIAQANAAVDARAWTKQADVR